MDIVPENTREKYLSASERESDETIVRRLVAEEDLERVVEERGIGQRPITVSICNSVGF